MYFFFNIVQFVNLEIIDLVYSHTKEQLNDQFSKIGLNDGSSVLPVQNNTVVSYHFIFFQMKCISNSKYYFYVAAQ